MKIMLNRISTVLIRMMLTLCLLLCVAALYLGAFQDREHRNALILAVVACLLFFLMMPSITRWLSCLGPVKCLLLLTLFCAAVKCCWVLMVRVPVAGDYQVFWEVANDLAWKEVIHNRYVALFPHIFGYSSFLSLFLCVLGPLPLLPQMLNVLLTLCSGAALFFLCWRWCSLQSGIAAYLLWTLCPSQTIYNSMVLSEPLYTALLLGFLALIAWAEDKTIKVSGNRRLILLGASTGCICGLLLRGIQAARPIAAVPLIALFLWLLLQSPKLLFAVGCRRLWLPLVVLTVAVYGATGPLWQEYMTARLGEEPAGTPGYSILVGFNMASEGCWNAEDSELLNVYNIRPETTAEDAQRALLEAAKERIAAEQQKIPHLIRQKLRVFLGADNSCVAYSSAVLRHTVWFSWLCNGFYYAVLFLAVFGILRLWKNGTSSGILLVPLYILGLTLAQMLVEVAGRYHYSLVPMLVIISTTALPAHTRKLTILYRMQIHLQKRGRKKRNA